MTDKNKKTKKQATKKHPTIVNIDDKTISIKTQAKTIPTKKQKKEKAKDIIAWIVVGMALTLIFVGVIIGIISQAFDIVANDKDTSEVGIPALQLSASLFIATIFALSILILLIYKLFWHKMKKHLEIRKENISANISVAKYKNEEAEENYKKSEISLKGSKSEGNKIIEASIKEAKIEKRSIKDETKKEADLILERAREQIEREKASMESDIKKEILETSILAAQKIIEKELDEKTNKKMINELIDKL